MVAGEPREQTITNTVVDVRLDDSNLYVVSKLRDSHYLVEAIQAAAQNIYSAFQEPLPPTEDPPELQKLGFSVSPKENGRVYVKPVTRVNDTSEAEAYMDGAVYEYDTAGRLTYYEQFNDHPAIVGRAAKKTEVELTIKYDSDGRVTQTVFKGDGFLDTGTLLDRVEHFIRDERGSLTEWKVCFKDPDYPGELVISAKFKGQQ